MMIATERHQARRAALNARLSAGLVVLPTARVQRRNNDNDFTFRFDSDFHYLTGFPEPEAVLVMVLGAQPRTILFCLPKNETMEIWEGFRYGPAAARGEFGFDEAYPIEEFDQRMVELLAHQPTLYCPVGDDERWDARLIELINRARRRGRGSYHAAPLGLVDIRATIGEMRLIKDAHEADLMREAGRISADAHIRAMRAARPGMFEYEIEAELLHEFYRRGSRYPAYGAIVASGANATCLHYHQNDRRMEDGDLLLIDAGCELHGYAADITRTFPINGRFSGPQKDVYELVLAAMHSAFDAVRPGRPRGDYHTAAVRTLTAGLVDLGLLQGEVDGLIEQLAYKQFYMHGTGHWLGMDVHDTGEYEVDGVSRPLLPGMVLTVEPGLYFRPAANVPEHFVGIGVRIEDDLLLTEDGFDNLSAGVPKTVAEIEALMADRA
ncbi:Xaa-Pro aminopeptidase [Chitinimonas lacunae]|uniref:Xaa-Pro aminopeptidase n=1 Tax=Chitinimonas lacunae TaxID=1963018 RepID=A0ABV8MSL2_9NEIS